MTSMPEVDVQYVDRSEMVLDRLDSTKPLAVTNFVLPGWRCIWFKACPGKICPDSSSLSSKVGMLTIILDGATSILTPVYYILSLRRDESS